MDAPVFFTVQEFATIFGRPVGVISHAARNYVDPTPANANELPPGWGAFKWEGRYVIYDLQDADIIRWMFRLNDKMQRTAR